MERNSMLNPLRDKHFKTLILALAEKFEPLQIICFGARISYNEVSGSFIDSASEQTGHYALLMVTESVTRIDHEAQDYANAHFKPGKATVLCHGKQTVDEAIIANSRFFTSVYAAGYLVYSKDGMPVFDFECRYVPSLAAVKAKKHFDHRISLAEGFLSAAGECISRSECRIGVFMLHQAVEQSCIGLVKVHLAYRLEMHNLRRSLHLCLCFSSRPYELFITGDMEDDRLFDLLLRSYSHARYKDDFAVSDADAQVLLSKVSAFLVLAAEMCAEKIADLQREEDCTVIE